jgi:tetratricopeptide (TPR) repeat protein
MSQKKPSVSSSVQFKSLGQRLRRHRLHLGLSQEALAEAIGASARSIRRWEQDQAVPQEVMRTRMCTLFEIDPRSLLGAQGDEQAASTTPSFWHVPLPRNPLFTGREDLLHALHEKLKSEQRLALTQSWAISGLGGIGKTQIALEYAYQYRQDYVAVFWISAATLESIRAGLLAVAECLYLPEKDEHDPLLVIRAVRQWLATHQDWLLILDNADDVTIISDVLPVERSGYLLLTTRAQALGSVAQRLEVETMGVAEGTLFLLRRAKLLALDAFLDRASHDHLAAAEAIVIEMDFLPLALDQAGAYIEEVGCSLSTYLELYRAHRAELLRRRGQMPGDYPASVATTWSLNFEQVEQANLAAGELLRLCAFLSPDAIPEELFSEGSTVLGPVLEQAATDVLALNGAIEELRKFSLVQRDPEARLLRLHRLVQAVIQDALPAGDRCRWAERAVRATRLMFTRSPKVSNWSQDQRFLPQAQACSVLIQEYAFEFAEAAALLQWIASYLYIATLYEQVEPLYQQALRIWEKMLGPEHPQTAYALSGLATLFRVQKKFEQAEALYRKALHIREQAFGPEHPDVALALGDLGALYTQLGRYEQAESLFQRALHIRELALEPDHLDVAISLNQLALLFMQQGKYEQAEPLYQQALGILEHGSGNEDPDVARPLNNLAELYLKQGNYERAEPLYQRALQIWEQVYGPEHPNTALLLTNLAELYRRQKKDEQVEPLCRRVLRIWEQAYGPGHPHIGYTLNTLASLYTAQEHYEQAEPLYQRALQIWEQAYGPEHPDVAETLNGLANLSSKQGVNQRAELLYQRALAIREHTLGEHHLETAETLHDFAVFQQAQGRHQEAAALCQRALSTRKQVLGAEHPTTTATHTAYLALLRAMSLEEQAASLERAR